MFGVGVEEGKITMVNLDSPCPCLAYFSREGKSSNIILIYSFFFYNYHFETYYLIFLIIFFIKN
jgi:hypothetical protein